jgi:hypothetical protein
VQPAIFADADWQQVVVLFIATVAAMHALDGRHSARPERLLARAGQALDTTPAGLART